MFQSTRPRGARLARGEFPQSRHAVSIHAPARGATAPRRERGEPARVSIHAPARGATFLMIGISYFYFSFNPRAREGRDAIEPRTQNLPRVSIHAPARGATANRGNRVRFHYVSIHAPARGATKTCRQSFPSSAVSIHAPARGATSPVFAKDADTGVSIHAPARGATFCAVLSICAAACFNPRAREGRDLQYM